MRNRSATATAPSFFGPAAVLVALTMLLAACGSSHSSTGASTSTTAGSPRAVYRKCLANHGVKVPDRPGQGGGGQGAGGFGGGPSSLPPGVDRATLDKAREACKDKLPLSIPSAGTPEERAALQAYADCLTRNGYPAPDATHGRVVFNGSVDRSDPAFQAADRQCAPRNAPIGATTSTSGGG